jgi:hypothetical protein
MLTCMIDLTGAKVLKGERILFNAFKEINFASKMNFEKLRTYSSVREKLIDFDICGFIGVMIVVHNTGLSTEKFLTIINCLIRHPAACNFKLLLTWRHCEAYQEVEEQPAQVHDE